jgi:hypothetical protein
MKRALLIVFSALLFNQIALAQNTGYMGRHFIVKSDLMQQLIFSGFSVELEAAVLRRLSLTAAFGTQDKKLQFGSDGSYYSYSGFIQPIGTWNFKCVDYTVGLRYYLQSEQPAPKGGYLFGNYGLGKAEVSGRQKANISGYYEEFEYYDVVARNIPVKQFNLGFGYQSIFFHRVVFDFSMSYIQSQMMISQKYADDLLETSDAYGANTLKIGEIGYGSYSVPTYGINVNLKLGLLIF